MEGGSVKRMKKKEARREEKKMKEGVREEIRTFWLRLGVLEFHEAEEKLVLNHRRLAFQDKGYERREERWQGWV